MIIGGIVFLLVIAGLLVLVFVGQNRLSTTDEEQQEPPQMEEENPYGITTITAKHFYIDGVHTLAGEIAMPTPCDLIDTTAMIAESMPEQVTVDFEVINNSEMCAQVVTNQRFKISFEASEEASIRARFMGDDVELNLVPPAEGETPEDFELYIKG